VQWKINKYYIFWVCVFSTRLPACNAHASYFHLWSAPLYNIFPHYLTNGRTFGKKSYWTQKVCFDFLYNFCVKHFSFWAELCEIWKSLYCSSFLSDFNEKWILCTVFRKIFKYQISWQTFRWKPSCSILTGGLTGMMKLIVALLNFAKAPKNVSSDGVMGDQRWIGQHVEGDRSNHLDILPSLLLVEKSEKFYSLWILES